MSRLGLALVGCSLSLLPAARAAIHVVDVANGPGADFTSLGAAVLAAAPGDTLLVRGGVYDGFHLDGKGLGIFADAGASVWVQSVASTSRIRNLPAGEHVVVRGLRFTPISPIGGSALVGLELDHCAGVVALEECVVDSGGPSVAVTACAAVSLIRCSIVGSMIRGDAGLVVAASSASLHECDVAGGDGQDGGLGPWNPIPSFSGGDGVVLADHADLNAVNSALRGGRGGDGYDDFGAVCVEPEDGGAGLRHVGPLTPLTRLSSTTVAGGAAGAVMPCNTTVPVAGPAVALDSGRVLRLAALGPSLTAATPSREGEGTTLEVTGSPGVTALLLIAAAPAAEFVDPVTGSLLVGSPTSIVALGPIPRSGHLTLTLRVRELGALVEEIRAHAQVVSLTAAGPRLGSATAILWLDASY